MGFLSLLPPPLPNGLLPQPLVDPPPPPLFRSVSYRRRVSASARVWYAFLTSLNRDVASAALFTSGCHLSAAFLYADLISAFVAVGEMPRRTYKSPLCWLLGPARTTTETPLLCLTWRPQRPPGWRNPSQWRRPGGGRERADDDDAWALDFGRPATASSRRKPREGGRKRSPHGAVHPHRLAIVTGLETGARRETWTARWSGRERARVRRLCPCVGRNDSVGTIRGDSS